MDSGKKRHLCNPALQIDLPPNAVCVANCSFNTCEQPFHKSAGLQCANMLLMRRISPTCNTILRFKSLAGCGAFTHSPEPCPGTSAHREKAAGNAEIHKTYFVPDFFHFQDQVQQKNKKNHCNYIRLKGDLKAIVKN